MFCKNFQCSGRFKLQKDGDSICVQEAGYYPCKVYPRLENDNYVIVPVSEKYNEGRTPGGLSSANTRIQKAMGPALAVCE